MDKVCGLALKNKVDVVSGIRGGILGKMTLRMESHTSYRWLPDSPFVTAPDFCLASVTPHSPRLGCVT